MILCDDGHDEVCYEKGHCPVCEKIDEVENLEMKITDLESEIEDLKEG